ncbi:MAG: HU family DNA-binding protein [Bacteroidales bacterium]
MALDFYKVKRTMQVKGVKEERYVARLIRKPKVTQEMVIDRIVERGTASRGDVEMVIGQLAIQIGQVLENGQSLKLDRFGIFRPAFKCKSVTKPEEVDVDTIQDIVARFTVSGEMNQKMKNATVRFVDLDAKKHA